VGEKSDEMEYFSIFADVAAMKTLLLIILVMRCPSWRSLRSAGILRMIRSSRPDLSGLSIKNPRVRVVHQRSAKAGGSMYLQKIIVARLSVGRNLTQTGISRDGWSVWR